MIINSQKLFCIVVVNWRRFVFAFRPIVRGGVRSGIQSMVWSLELWTHLKKPADGDEWMDVRTWSLFGVLNSFHQRELYLKCRVVKWRTLNPNRSKGTLSGYMMTVDCDWFFPFIIINDTLSDFKEGIYIIAIDCIAIESYFDRTS